MLYIVTGDRAGAPPAPQRWATQTGHDRTSSAPSPPTDPGSRPSPADTLPRPVQHGGRAGDGAPSPLEGPEHGGELGHGLLGALGVEDGEVGGFADGEAVVVEVHEL